MNKLIYEQLQALPEVTQALFRITPAQILDPLQFHIRVLLRMGIGFVVVIGQGMVISVITANPEVDQLAVNFVTDSGLVYAQTVIGPDQRQTEKHILRYTVHARGIYLL